MLNRKVSMIMGVLFLVLVGCTDGQDDAQSPSNNTQQNKPVRFESQQEQYDSSLENVGYPSSEDTNYHTDDFTDPYSNEEAVYIYNQLIKRDEILSAQVASTEDRIVVSVMLEPHFNHDTKPNEEDIEGYVREIVPSVEKDIIVYTDNIEWDKRKNDNARQNDN